MYHRMNLPGRISIPSECSQHVWSAKLSIILNLPAKIICGQLVTGLTDGPRQRVSERGRRSSPMTARIVRGDRGRFRRLVLPAALATALVSPAPAGADMLAVALDQAQV